MNYNKQHISNSKKLIRKMSKPFTHITIHSTSNSNSTAQNERDNLNRKGNTSSTGFHIAIDDKQAIECIPLDTVAYHAGDGGYGQGNSHSIGIEMCESGNREKVLERTIKVTKHLMDKYNIPIDNVVRHYDWSKKNCPRILNYNNWEGWRIFLDKLKVDSPHWALLHYNNLIDKGYTIHEKRFDDNMTRGEIFALLDRIL